jgi:phosphoglycolate phosphatase-like HAD superfamily hydrolase
MSTLILFDIDGTLVLTGGAGERAMNRAFAELAGVAGAFHGIQMAGRTDPIILDEAVSRAGLAWSGAERDRFRARYCELLHDELQTPNPKCRAMPGVESLVGSLAADRSLFVALLTGNYAEGARVKLSHFDLWRHFRCGAFGDDAEERAALVPVAVARARGMGLAEVPVERVVVVGDTPLDVACARANGVRAVAVATGPYSERQLADSGAHAVLPDLSDAAAFKRAIGAPAST